MKKEVVDFITSHNIGCLTTEIKEGIHAAAVHITFVPDRDIFLIQTNLDSRKCELLREQNECKASLVIGFSEEEWKTFQADGTVRLLNDAEERKRFSEIRQKQYPSPDYTDDPEVAFLEFTPNWWRYTDSNTKPKNIISSDDQSQVQN